MNGDCVNKSDFVFLFSAGFHYRERFNPPAVIWMDYKQYTIYVFYKAAKHKTSWSVLEFREEAFITARWCCERVQTKTSGNRPLHLINHLFHSCTFGLLFGAEAERGAVTDGRSIWKKTEFGMREEEEEEETQLVGERHRCEAWQKCCVMSQFVWEEVCHWFCVINERKHTSHSPRAPTAYWSPVSLRDTILLLNAQGEPNQLDK